ncbi:hypothetical protein AU510_01745 [Lonsdalea britannica]|nr:hypothetical protein AU510_01745 [Lonsdalea britannica]
MINIICWVFARFNLRLNGELFWCDKGIFILLIIFILSGFSGCGLYAIADNIQNMPDCGASDLISDHIFY